MKRIHQVSVQVSTRLFLKQNGRCAYTPDVLPLDAVQEKGWRPLLLYAITCEGSLLRSARLAELAAPRPLEDVVCEQWMMDEWLKGPPDAIRMDPDLAAAAPGFVQAMQNRGIEVIVERSKSLAANRRAIDADAYAATYSYEPGSSKRTNPDLAQLNANWIESARFGVTYSGTSSPARRASVEAWMALDGRPTPPRAGSGMDWNAGDFLFGGFRNAVVVKPKRDRLDQPLVLDERSLLHEAPFDAMLASWPESLNWVARAIGVTEPQLRSFIRQRAAIYQRSAYALAAMLDLEIVGGYEDAGYEAVGAYLFTPRTPGAADATLDAVTLSDYEFRGFIEPIDARVRPRERVFVFQRCGGLPSTMLVDPDDWAKNPAKWQRALPEGEGPYLVPTLQFTKLWGVITAARTADAFERGRILRTGFAELDRMWERMSEERAWFVQTPENFEEWGCRVRPLDRARGGQLSAV